MAFDESAAFTPPAAFGPYRVLHQIGSGVLGPVFRTYDPQQDRLVAVKAFRMDVVPETVARLADNLRRLAANGPANPTVVQVLDAGLEGMSAYLAMEYVSAETLDVALRHLAPAPLDRVLPMLTELAQAIEAAWAAGCGHGAIHPRDVFVLSGTNDVRLTGCGVVPALEAVGIKVPARRPYAAPERGTSEGWDIRADIYSLGVLAHELLTKRRPGGANEQDGSLVTGTSPEARVLIRRVLAAALAERPEARFATPMAFVDALGAIVRGEPVGALPEGANTPASTTNTNTADDRPAASHRKVSEPPPLLALSEAPVESDPASGAAREPAMPIVPAEPATQIEPHVPIVPAHVSEPAVAIAAVAPVATPDPVPAPSAPARRPPLSTSAPSPTRRLSSPTPESPVFSGLSTSGGRDRTPPMGRPASPPPMRVSPPPVIVPVRGPFPWVAVLAAAVASGTLFGVSGYWMGLRHPPAEPVAVGATNQAAPPPGTDVLVPPPLVPGGNATPSPQSPASSSSASPAASNPAPPASAADTRAPARSTAPAKGKPDSVAGSLVIESRPAGARVVLDGKSLGVTPLTLTDLRAGSHPLRLERVGYKTLITSVVIKSGERSRVAVTLELSGAPGPWMPLSR